MRVVLAEDHGLMRVGMQSALASSPEIQIVGEAQSGTQVLPLVRRVQPDVVLLDVDLPGLDGFGCLELLRRNLPDVRVVMLSSSSDPAHVGGALRRGASAYVVKSINAQDLAAVLRQVVDGTVFTAVAAPGLVSDAAGAAGLTEKEIEILRGVADGLSNREIGRSMWVTEQTVKFHLTNVYRKLGVANRTEAARAAYRLGIAESPVLDMLAGVAV